MEAIQSILCPLRHQSTMPYTAGRSRRATLPSKHDEVDTYTPAFRAAVVDGKAGSVMCAYNAINGEPACANEFLLQDELRGKWGFKGYVVSDCDAVRDVAANHRYRPTQATSIDAVITSPPYPNEKDYTRTTRLESVLLGFIQSKEDLRALKRNLVRSNTRGVYKADLDDLLVNGHLEIERIAAEIENRRIALGKTSGFERLYARVTKLYFGGMKQHLADLRSVLRPGAKLAYVVGDQASYLRVMIRTGELLADIATSLGYEVIGIDLFRTRLATATREQLREEVVLLRWPGKK